MRLPGPVTAYAIMDDGDGGAVVVRHASVSGVVDPGQRTGVNDPLEAAIVAADGLLLQHRGAIDIAHDHTLHPQRSRSSPR